MPKRPYVLDNLSADTMHGAGLANLIADYHPKYGLSVATGYVNLGGLHHLALCVADGRKARLLIGAAPDPGLRAQLPPMSRFEEALKFLVEERDLARFPPSRAAAKLVELDEWLSRDDVEVKRYVDKFLHGKAYLLGSPDDPRAALISSANLTGAGLFNNLELGLVSYDPPPSEAALEWFQALWDSAIDYKAELKDLLFPKPQLIDPQTVYLRALLELYGEEAAQPAETRGSSEIALADFQRDGYIRARRILEKHHGVIYADGVGTGKTEVGLSFIEEYAVQKGQHALVVAPAQLVENWQSRISQAQLPAQVISFNQLYTDEQLAEPNRRSHRYLHNRRDAYRLIVVDEAHGFRNPDTHYYRAMERLLGGEKKDIILLTATPINNGLWDLYNLVMLFAKHDRAFAADGIASIRDLFVAAGANERDPENLDPDVLFPLADRVSVRRDRSFIETHYPGATFPDGTPVRFPTPHLETHRYDIDTANEEMFDDIISAIKNLTMARYRPSAYALDVTEENSAEQKIGGLLQSGLLKRFESCWWACLQTVERMVAAHDAFLAAWEEGKVPSRDALRRLAADELDEGTLATWLDETLSNDSATGDKADFAPAFGQDVAADRVLLARIATWLRNLDPADDLKLQKLRTVLAQTPSPKVAVFATYGDTIRYLDQHLGDVGRERVVVIGADGDPDSRSAALGRFCPKTVVRPDYEPPDGEVDLLLATDVLSEGQNLQQAGAVVSYDMPWNPQRVVQRNGRVIRLKSPHNHVYLATLLPRAGEFEKLLQLESTIRRKVAAAAVYGMESGVIEGVESELRAYAARLLDDDSTLLDESDGDDSAATFAGEALRAEVRRAATEGEIRRLTALPWGIGSAFAQGVGIPSTGAPGVFFACRTSSTKEGRRYWRFVQSDGTVVSSEAEMLRRIDPGPARGFDIAAKGHFDLERSWRATVQSILEEHNRLADPRVYVERIGPAQQFALELLRDPSVVLPDGAEEADTALSVERSSTVRQRLVTIRTDVLDGVISRDEGASRVVEVVEFFGLAAVPPAPVLHLITEEDLGVVCWMAVEAPS